MIISLLLKNWKTIIDGLLIVGAILLIFLWNPFNIFGGGLKLQDTANMVSEIKEIGELVTAEYYGEVIASNEEAELEILEKDSIERVGELLYFEIKKGIYNSYQDRLDELEDEVGDIKREKKRIRKREQGLGKIKQEIITNFLDENWRKSVLSVNNSDIFNSLILFLGQHEHGVKINTKKFVKKSDNDKMRYVNKTLSSVLNVEYDKIIRAIEGDIAYANYMSTGFQSLQRYTDFFYDHVELKKPRKERKMDLAVIGRGSVKAGFKFDELNDQNFVYDETRKIIHFFGFQAGILNQDINPWFIPERKVPGFQIIAEHNADFYNMKEIKIHCVEKLVHNATKAGILEQAQKNGEEALQEFFSLVIGDEIKQVVFHDGQLIYQSNTIIQDSVINYDELEVINAAVIRAHYDINNEENTAIKDRREKLLKEFLTKLQQYKIHIVKGDNEYQLPFNFYNRHIPTLLLDSMVTEDEISWIADSLRHQLYDSKSNRYKAPNDKYWFWFDDSLKYITSFNAFMKRLTNAKDNKGFFKTTHLVSLDMATPKNGSDSALNAFTTEINKIIEDGDGTISYSIEQETVKFYQWSEIDAPTYLNYPIIDGVKLWSDFVYADSTLEWFKPVLTNQSLEIKGYTSVLTDTSMTVYSSESFDKRIFEDLGVNYDFLLDNATFSRNTIEVYNRVPFSELLADTLYPQRLRRLSFEPSMDSLILQSVSLDSMLVHSSDQTISQKKWAIDHLMSDSGTFYIEKNVVDSVKVSIGASIGAYLHKPGNDYFSQGNNEVIALRNYILNRNRSYNDVSDFMRFRKKVDKLVGLDSIKVKINKWAADSKKTVGSLR